MKTIKTCLLLFTLMILASACNSHHYTMQYFTDIDSLAASVPSTPPPHLIEPNDNLSIVVTSTNPEATEMYNLPVGNPATKLNAVNQASPEQQSYQVDPQGYITMPVLGRVYVKGLTVEQLRDELTKRISQEVNNPVVTVNISGFRINVAGEVNHPGTIWAPAPRYTILDALTAAGDLNQYGRRDNILLIRETDGRLQHVRLNLNSADLLTSPYYYLKQNDYVYVEPNGVRQDNAEYNTNNAFKLSVTSTIVSGCASVISLIIALTR